MATETTFLGNMVNVMGAMLLLVAVYFYAQFRRFDSSVRGRVARQRTTAVLLFFLFFVYTTTVFSPVRERGQLTSDWFLASTLIRWQPRSHWKEVNQNL